MSAIQKISSETITVHSNTIDSPKIGSVEKVKKAIKNCFENLSLGVSKGSNIGSKVVGATAITLALVKAANPHMKTYALNKDIQEKIYLLQVAFLFVGTAQMVGSLIGGSIGGISGIAASLINTVRG